MHKSSGIIVVDIDGTICDSSERLKSINFDPSLPIDQWPGPDGWGDHSTDKPIQAVIDLINGVSDLYQIWICTIRHPTPATSLWLRDNNVKYDKLFMLGREGDDRVPADIKEVWLDSLLPEERNMIVMSLEDSPGMIDMFRSYGIRTLDVGQFEGSMK